MKAKYYPYTDWEDAKNGMFRTPEVSNSLEKINQCIELLCHEYELERIMRLVVCEWKKSAEMNFSNNSRNKRAWLGQAACCYCFHAPENTTKVAWNMLSEQEQQRANDVADRIIQEWVMKYEKENGD